MTIIIVYDHRICGMVKRVFLFGYLKPQNTISLYCFEGCVVKEPNKPNTKYTLMVLHFIWSKDIGMYDAWRGCETWYGFGFEIVPPKVMVFETDRKLDDWHIDNNVLPKLKER